MYGKKKRTIKHISTAGKQFRDQQIGMLNNRLNMLPRSTSMSTGAHGRRIC